MALKPNTTKNKKYFSKLTLIALVFLFIFCPLSYISAQKKIDYAYDYKGQRIMEKVTTTSYNPNTGYTTTTVETTYYPTPTYNFTKTTTEVRDKNGNLVSEENTEGATKHIFVNDLNIATIEGSGEDAKVYTNLTGNLNSSSVVLDEDNQVVETTDYYPFGKIRLDEKTGAFSEQRKYIGQEYDADTGLNYLNARYYNTDLARFISQDPMFWNFDSSWLADPQNQNAYAYARNNPITLSDPNGLRTDVMSEPLSNPLLGFFAGHSTAIVNPDPGEILYMDYNNMCYQITEPTTLAGYTTGSPFNGLSIQPQNWRLDVRINDLGAISTYEKAITEGLPHVAVVTVDAQREGMTNQQLDQNVLNNMVSMQGDQGQYNPFGMRWWSANSNCHNTTTTSLERSGVSSGQISDIGNKLYGNNKLLIPGVGNKFSTPATTQVISQQISNTWHSIKQTFSNIISKIKN